MSDAGKPRIDYTNKDYAALREAMLALAEEKLPEWTDHSPNDLGVVLLELFAHCADIMLYYQDRIANESYLDTATERRSIVNLLRLIGYELRPPTSASADLTLLFKRDAKGTVTIPKGAAFQTTAKATGTPVGFQYLRDSISIDLEKLPELSDASGKRFKRLRSTLPVVQVDATIGSEIVGSSDGSALQRFALARAPLIDDQLEVRVHEGHQNGPLLWQRRDTLLNSTADARHYRVRRDASDVAVIEFGDGRHGKIPARGRNNIIAAYRAGGGSKGNVPPRTIVKSVTQIESLASVFNAVAATGGADAESSEQAVLRGPQLFKSQQRAVTADDYVAHAKAFGVGKARARAATWNRVTLFVAPVGGGQPTDTLKEDLRRYFDTRRIMTTLLDIKDPTYVKVFIGGTMQLNAYYYTEQVQQRVRDAIALLFAFERVDFEHTAYLSKIYEAIEAVEGVANVNVEWLSRSCEDGASDLPKGGCLGFGWEEIPLADPVVWKRESSESLTWRWRTWSFD